VDRAALGRGLAAIERLAPAHLISAHLPRLEGKVTTLTRPLADFYCKGPVVDPVNAEYALAPFAKMMAA
jgi:hypothetical protein